MMRQTLLDMGGILAEEVLLVVGIAAIRQVLRMIPVEIRQVVTSAALAVVGIKRSND